MQPHIQLNQISSNTLKKSTASDANIKSEMVELKAEAAAAKTDKELEAVANKRAEMLLNKATAQPGGLNPDRKTKIKDRLEE